MKISTRSRYAMRFLLELALLDDDGTRTTTQKIALDQGISKKYLESIATKLARAGIIESAKGVGGGFWLAKPPEDITVGAVMCLMEKSLFHKHCITHPQECVSYGNCVMMDLWDALDEAIHDVVDRVTLADIRDKALRLGEQCKAE